MKQKLQTLIANYRAKLLATPNIQVIETKLSNEVIKFSGQQMHNTVLEESTFKSSTLINMKFIYSNFNSSYFEKCLIENCIFNNTYFAGAEFTNCVFKNCRFVDCNLSDLESGETIFNKCTFIKTCFNNAIFESCHFLKPIFKGVQEGPIGSAVLINSKFSNSKKLIKFEGAVYFTDIFDQINQLYI